MKSINKLLIGLFLFALFSCSNDLNNRSAKILILENIPKDLNETFLLKRSDYSIRYRRNAKALEPFSKEGLLNLNIKSGFVSSLNISPTINSNEYVVDSSRFSFEVYFSKLSFGEIKGIKENPGTNSAKVEFSLIRKELSPFGIIYGLDKNQEIMVTAYFEKYKDGWRFKNWSEKKLIKKLK